MILNAFVLILSGQDGQKAVIEGELVTVLIQDGDTIIIADLDGVTVSTPRKFGSTDEYKRYIMSYINSGVQA